MNDRRSSDLQEALDTVFGTNEEVRVRNANGTLGPKQRWGALLLAGGSLVVLIALVALFVGMLFGSPVSLGACAFGIAFIGAGLWFAWKSFQWLRDAIRGTALSVEGQGDLRADRRYRGPSYYYVRVGGVELRIPYAAWSILRENKQERWRICYMPRTRRAISITQKRVSPRD